MARILAGHRHTDSPLVRRAAPAYSGQVTAVETAMLATRIRPRFSDTDALGHINNTVIPVWFLEAREPVLRWFAPDNDLSVGALAVVRIEVDYLNETHFGDDVEIRSGVARIGNSSFQLRQEVWQAGQCTARGLATLVNFDRAARRARGIPDSIRETLEEHLWAGEDNEKAR